MISPGFRHSIIPSCASISEYRRDQSSAVFCLRASSSLAVAMNAGHLSQSNPQYASSTSFILSTLNHNGVCLLDGSRAVSRARRGAACGGMCILLIRARLPGDGRGPWAIFPQSPSPNPHLALDNPDIFLHPLLPLDVVSYGQVIPQASNLLGRILLTAHNGFHLIVHAVHLIIHAQ